LKCYQYSKKNNAISLGKKVGKIVRIVGQEKVIYLQMLRLSDKMNGYEPKYVATLEEAEELLNELSKEEPAASAA
jgi:hypothetical protein